MKFAQYGSNLKKAARAWIDDDAMTMSAALSYYLIFSISPLLLIAIAVAGFFWGTEGVRTEVFHAIQSLLGDQGAHAIESFVDAAGLNHASFIATLIGVLTLMIGATSLFAQLQDSLNLIWKVKTKPHRGLWPLVRQRLLSLSLIIVIAFLLLISLLVSAVISAVGRYAAERLPGGEFMWHLADIAISFGVVTVLFAAIYKILPDVMLRWRDVWAGGVMTALLFTGGKFLIGVYLGHSGTASAYGAAGSLAVVLVWTYYSSMVLFLGAEFTRFSSFDEGQRPELKEHAEWIQPPSPSTL